MELRDFSVHHSGLNSAIKLFSSLTHNALPKSDYEVHTHYQEFEIYWFLDGDLAFAYEGKHLKVENGGMILIANGMLHRPVLRSNCRYYRKRILFSKDIFIRFNTMDFGLYAKLKKRKILLMSKEMVEKAGIDTLFCDIENSLVHSSPYNDFCALINLFSLLIKVEKYSEHNDGVLDVAHSEKIAQIISYIDNHLSEDLTYQSLSEVLHISEKSLYKFFKNETGFALGNYISERRITIAQSILNRGDSARNAAFAAGFKDYSSFYRCFLKKVGITPAEYIKSIGR